MGKQSKTKPAREQKDGGPALNAYGQLLQVAEAARPYAEAAWRFAMAMRARAAPYASDADMLALTCGFVLTFFGARFMATIAAAEAFRITGWERSKRGFEILSESYARARDASAKDDAADDDADGVPDAMQIPLRDLVARKTTILLKATRPDDLAEALSGMYGGLAAVVATLRVQFAQTVTFGVAIADSVAERVAGPAEAAINARIPEEYSKFAPILLRSLLRALGVSLAFALRRFAAAGAFAARGAQLLARGTLAVASRTGRVSAETAADEAFRSQLQAAFAAAGIAVQLSLGFGAPFPFNVLFMPLSVFEWLLVAVVGATA
mmetsp:Transcript_5785/g.19704  ORF Transcript_5785/g.19704 Transcript_5785/m.19704 type:complete len:323 (+) Transcript_5785:66-1034(+)